MMEISGVRTVLVLCDRQHHFRDYFRRRSPDRAIGGCDYEFGQTRYVYIRGQNWRGLRPDETRWATLGPCPVANLERLNEAEAIASRYERIFLEEENRPVESRRHTAAEVMGQRRFTGASLRVVRRTFVDGEMVEEDVQLPQPSSMRIERMIVDDPIARHDSSEYIEEMARVRYATEIQRLASMESLGLDISIPSTPRPENIYSAWLGDSRVRDREAIGNTQCKFNAMSRHLRCAVRPEADTCSGCTDFEERV